MSNLGSINTARRLVIRYVLPIFLIGLFMIAVLFGTTLRNNEHLVTKQRDCVQEVLMKNAPEFGIVVTAEILIEKCGMKSEERFDSRTKEITLLGSKRTVGYVLTPWSAQPVVTLRQDGVRLDASESMFEGPLLRIYP